jgi:hypothetical protein
VIALLIWAPNVWWQATHGWPQLKMTAVIREDADWGGQAGLIPFQVLLLGPAVLFVWVSGLWRLLRNPEAMRFRAFGWAYLIVVVPVVVTGGREYYPAGAYPALLASGAITLDGWLERAPGRRSTVRWAAGVSGAVTVALGLPIYPVALLHQTPQPAVNYDSGETVRPPSVRFPRSTKASPSRKGPRPASSRANYGEAAIDHYGPYVGGCRRRFESAPSGPTTAGFGPPARSQLAPELLECGSDSATYGPPAVFPGQRPAN